MYGQITAAVIGLLVVRWWSRHTYSGLMVRFYTGRLMFVVGAIIVTLVMLPMRMFPKRRFNQYQASDYQEYH